MNGGPLAEPVRDHIGDKGERTGTISPAIYGLPLAGPVGGCVRMCNNSREDNARFDPGGDGQNKWIHMSNQSFGTDFGLPTGLCGCWTDSVPAGLSITQV